MTVAAVRTCAVCGQEMVRQRAGARYCSGACRIRAHRGIERRLGHAGDSPREARISVTAGTADHIVTSGRFTTPVTDKASIPRGFKRPSRKLDPRIVPDPVWPGMYRIRLPDGSLTDIANLTRAKDALNMETT
jgi:hypothetical protein